MPELLQTSAPENAELFIRPERIAMVKAPDAEGQVVSSSFLDSIQRVEVLWKSHPLLVETSSALNWSAGDRVTLRQSDTRQYEAANVLGATDWRQFLDITLPGVRYGILSAAFVVFTITDFGNAVVIGGDFSVLATEIYSQVSGQMKFGMGAVVGILLLLLAAVSNLD